jgi:hypothetical protein
MSTAHVEDLVDLEALGALSTEESAFVRAHAADCPFCAALLDDAEETAGRLALSVPLRRAPAEMRRRVMDEVTARPGADQTRPAAVPNRMPTPLMRFNRRWGALAAMIFLVPLAGLLTWNYILQHEVNNLKRENQQIQETQMDVVLLALPNSLRAELTPTVEAGSARGMVSWNPDAGKCMVRVRDLPPPEHGTTYQVFFQGQLDPRPAGELKPDEDGFASLVFDSSRWQGQEYRVWVSAVRGSAEPSTVLLWTTLRRN